MAREVPGSEIDIYGPEYGHGVYDEAADFREKMLKFFEK